MVEHLRKSPLIIVASLSSCPKIQVCEMRIEEIFLEARAYMASFDSLEWVVAQTLLGIEWYNLVENKQKVTHVEVTPSSLQLKRENHQRFIKHTIFNTHNSTMTQILHAEVEKVWNAVGIHFQAPCYPIFHIWIKDDRASWRNKMKTNIKDRLIQACSKRDTRRKTGWDQVSLW